MGLNCVPGLGHHVFHLLPSLVGCISGVCVSALATTQLGSEVKSTFQVYAQGHSFARQGWGACILSELSRWNAWARLCLGQLAALCNRDK